MPPRKILPKCDICAKSITNKSPGLECSKCEKIVHATTACSGLTTKQIAALRNSESLEWTCDECQKSTSRRRSYISGGEDDDEEIDGAKSYQPKNNTFPIDIKKLLSDISKDVEKAIKKELGELAKSVNYCCDKVEDFEDEAKILKTKVKELENRNRYLELKIGALEQRHNELEQGQLCKSIEIVGIPPAENENVEETVKTVAKAINVRETSIKSSKRLPTRDDKVPSIVVKLTSEESQAQWIAAGRSARLKLKNLREDTSDTNDCDVFIRPKLSYYNKALLGLSKMKLKDAGYKYVWIKNGRILARKEEQGKIVIIRNEDDINRLIA
ncbi:hypothetical protein NE865_03680 [Phthorimaea operculella]|nr:hypothetical protein NE865_03680 [Phthorimaea operculella]